MVRIPQILVNGLHRAYVPLGSSEYYLHVDCPRDEGFSIEKKLGMENTTAPQKIRSHQELNGKKPPMNKNLRKWFFFLQSTEMRYNDGLASYTQIIHNLNMAPSSKPLLCDVIYVWKQPELFTRWSLIN